MVPECADEFVEGAIGRADADVVADDVVCGDSDDAPCQRVLAPGGEGVLVEFVDAGGVVVVRATSKRGPTWRIIYFGRDGT